MTKLENALSLLKYTTRNKRLALRVFARIMKLSHDEARKYLEELRAEGLVVKSRRIYEGEETYYLSKKGKEMVK